ncbi:hypothetical protein PAEPH01_0836 [Pancytospora epiphaga]|nr:hypothetical protein PAEPH01_0836 [Pancytospora epiphaga]
MLTIFVEGTKCLGKALYRTLDEVLFSDRITRIEALKILDLSKNCTPADIEEKYRRFYKANSVNNGGSPYIQMRILDAYRYLSDGPFNL